MNVWHQFQIILDNRLALVISYRAEDAYATAILSGRIIVRRRRYFSLPLQRHVGIRWLGMMLAHSESSFGYMVMNNW